MQEMNKTRVIVIYGGRSAEHEVSLKTAMTVINAIDQAFYEIVPVYIAPSGVWHCLDAVDGGIASIEELRVKSTGRDIATSIGEALRCLFHRSSHTVVFPVIHGTHGEDGTLQGLLELLNVPYVGNGVLASAAGMDKEMTKRIMTSEGIRQAAYTVIRLHEWENNAADCTARMEQSIGYPCYVKPANLGSSIGIHRCDNREEWLLAVEDAFRYDVKIVVEEEIRGREVQVAVLGTDEPDCSVAGEFEREPVFFDYEQKYMQGPLVQRIPAQVSAAVCEELRQTALRAFRALSGSGLMRVDFFVTEQDEVYLNEVNTFPGFTQNSMFPVLWNRTNGLTYAELINRLIRHAMEKHVRKQSIRYELPSEAYPPASVAGKGR
jgi:D-alanine-D-alanine ligase